MSDSQDLGSEDPNTLARATGNAAPSLRWWPAVCLLVGMLCLKFLPSVFDSPPLWAMMAGFMGPAVVGGILVLWWSLASRASVREKAVGTVLLLAIAGATIALSHFSMKGMGTMFFQLPVGLAAFGTTLVLLAGVPGLRLPVALLASVLGFGFWDFLELRGTTGAFKSEFAWRWTPSAEDEYLESLASGANPTISRDVVEETVLRAEAQWPDFRGAQRNNVVTGISLVEDWTQRPPKEVWKTRMGPGWSSFTLAGDRLFTQEQRGDKEAVVCLSAATGQIYWSHEYPGRFWEVIGGAGPRATPTIGDNALFALGADGHMVAIDPISGEPKWSRSLREDASREPPMWGWSSSPLLVGDLVLVHAGGADDKGVFAFRAETGESVWSVASGDHSYSSPQLAEFAGTQGVLMMTNAGLQFLDPASGAEIWNHRWPVDNYRAIQPLVLGNSILVATSMGIGTRRLEVSKQGSDWQLSESWTTRAMKPDYNDFVEYQGMLYGFDGNIFACSDLSRGKKQWKRGRYGNGQVLLLSDAGQLLLTSEKGELVLLKADPEKMVELAKFQAIEGKTWNHPILIDNHVFVRNGQEAACYELPLQDTTEDSKSDIVAQNP